MGIFNTSHSYGFISVFFHWLMALILLATFLLGLNLKDNFQNYDMVLMLHNSLGIVIFLLAVFRLCWRWLNILPDPLAKKKVLIKLATLIHILFYVIFFTMPLTGYLLTNLQGDVVNFFGTQLPELLERNSDIKRIIHSMHDILGNIILAMLTLHIIGALYHHYWLKDNTLRRMNFFYKVAFLHTLLRILARCNVL